MGDADNPHAHRVLAEDGGEGLPDLIGDHVVLISNHDQAQYDIGTTGDADAGDGVYAMTGFGDKIPPPGDGVAPSPAFVAHDSDGLPTAGCADSPALEVTEGYIRIHALQGNSNDGPGGARDDNGGDLVVLEIWNVEGGGTTEPEFARGDADTNGGAPNIADGIFILNFLFLGGPSPVCMDAADADDNGNVNITDGIFVLHFLFLGGPPPPAPQAPTCGEDGTSGDPLGCVSFPPCE